MTPIFSVRPLRMMVMPPLRGLGLERDLVAREFDDLLGRSRRRAGGQYLQPHQRAGLAADLLHHVVQPPADHVLEAAALALADAGDAIVGVQRAGHGGRTAGDHS